MGLEIISFLTDFVRILGQVLVWLIFAKVILSWIPTKKNSLTRFIDNSTAPIFAVAKRVTPNLGMIDFSPIVAYILVELSVYLLLKLVTVLAPFIINLAG